MSDLSGTPQYFERSGTDPGLQVPSSIPPLEPGGPTGPSGDGMSMIEHLSELRMRIITSVFSLVAAFGIGFYGALPVIEMLKGMAPESVVFVQLAPGEVLMASMRLALYAAVALASPVILYHLLRFVMPGLTRQERGLVLWAVLGGALLFVLGVVFAYYVVIPPALGFLVDYGQTVAQVQLSIEYYVSFCSALLFVTGGMFELPMLLFVLSFTGLVSSKRLMAEWRWAVVWIFIIAAVVTPTQDPFSMMMVGMAMALLYALSIVPIKLCGR